MFRIDTPGALPGGVWDEGNPFNAQDGTIASADWYNAVQEELAGFIESVGITLSKTDDEQFQAAIETYTGSRIDFTSTEVLALNQAYLLGNVFGIVRKAVGIGAPTWMLVIGKWPGVPKNTSEAFSVGDACWWDDTAEEMRNASATGRYRVGVAAADALAAAATMTVRLDGGSVVAEP